MILFNKMVYGKKEKKRLISKQETKIEYKKKKKRNKIQKNKHKKRKEKEKRAKQFNRWENLWGKDQNKEMYFSWEKKNKKKEKKIWSVP